MTYAGLDHWITTNLADDLDEEPPREEYPGEVTDPGETSGPNSGRKPFSLDEEAQRQLDWDEALIEFTEREAEDHPTRHIGGYYAGSAGRR